MISKGFRAQAYDWFERNQMLCWCAGICFALAVVVYWEFILNGVGIIYGQYDGISTLSFVTEQHRLLFVEGLPQWDFSLSIGGNNFLGLHDIFEFIPIVIGYGIGTIFTLLQLLKIVLSGVFFFSYLKKVRITQYTCLLGGVAYAFSEIILIRGFWAHYATEVCLFAMLLYASERFFQDGRWGLLIVALTFSFRSPINMYLYATLLLAYAIVRFYIPNGISKKIYVYLLKCAGLFCCSLLASSFFTFPLIRGMLQSHRFDSELSKVGAVFTGSLSIKMIVEKIFGLYSLEILGNATGSYPGLWSSPLVAPMLSAGLFCLIGLVFAIYYSKGRIRSVFAFLVIGISCYILFPHVSKLLAANVRGEYRFTSLSVQTLILVMAVYGLENHFQHCSLSKAKVMLAGVIALLPLIVGIVANAIYSYYKISNRYIVICSVISVLFVVVCLFSRNLSIRTSSFICIGLLFFQIITVTTASFQKVYDFAANAKFAVFKQSERALSNLGKISVADENLFYRISEGNTIDGRVRDLQQLVGYPGVHYVFDNNSFAVSGELFEFLSLIDSAGNVPYRYNSLNSFLGVKYLFGDLPDIYGYAPLRGTEGITINTLALPLGFTYDKYSREEDFATLDVSNRQLALLDSVIIGDGDNTGGLAPDVVDPVEKRYIEIPTQMLRYNNLNIITEITEDSITYDTTLSDSYTNVDPFITYSAPGSESGEPVSYAVTFDIDASVSGTGVIMTDWLGWPEVETNSTSFNISEGKKSYSIMHSGVMEPELRLDIPEHEEGTFTVSNVRLYDASAYNLVYEELITERRAETFELEKFSNNDFGGAITTTGDKFLMVSVPYDKGWTCYVDGVKTPLVKANIAFQGVHLTEGTHYVEWKYHTPYLYISLTITLVSIGLFIYLHIKRKNVFSLDFLREDAPKE
ncbi:MAG: YfhO family protein [Clostridiales bacterium]|jgi:uncharacterized membrane protein YfhO|nr:YfhO family protein [Clostridiales bacterium]